MRLKKTDLRSRVNANLAFRFEAEGLTSFAGLELLRRYFRKIDLSGLLRRHLRTPLPATDFGVVAILLLLLTLIIVGGRRLRHLVHLEGDPLVLRLCGLKHLPSPRTVGRWLAKLRVRDLGALLRVNEAVVASIIDSLGLARLTIDVDGSVVCAGQKVEGARRGYNPHHRKVPSYYPITAYEAQSGQILRVRNRSGNVHDGKASLSFLRDLFAQIRTSFGTRPVLEFRMDGAFFRQDVIKLLDAHGAEYAIKVPFYQWVGLKAAIQANRQWWRVDDTVSCFEKCVLMGPWDRYMRVLIYRKKVNHKGPKHYQLDLFDPADGHWEYSAIVTNKTLNGRSLWQFMCGRGGHEKVLGELKSGFAFDCLPTMRYAANGAWQILSMLAFNLMRGFQIATTAELRTTSRKRRARYGFEMIQTVRYLWLNRAAILVRPRGKPTLDVGTAAALRTRFEAADRNLREAA